MADNLQADLRNLVAERRVLVIVGSGVSIGATRNDPAASWIGLLELGVERCRALNPGLDAEWEKRLLGEIKSDDLDDLLSAAEKISRKLQAPTGGEFSRWLRETVGELKVLDAAVLEALRDLKVPLATTNYDDLLERVTGLKPVTWREGRKVFRFVNREEQFIFHFHGYWDDPESVVLGIRSYEQIRQDAHAQALRQALAMTQSLLFVGCGDGLSDPNFRPFLTWLREINASNEARHYRLAQEKDVVALQMQHPPEERIVVLPYDSDHAALAGFLRSLSSTTPITLASEPGRNSGAAPDPVPVATVSTAILEYLRRLEAATSKLQLIGLGQGVEAERPAVEVMGAPLESRVDQKTGIAFVAIPAGEFNMGSNESEDEKPVHRVHISKPFLLGKYQVTNQEYQRFLEANPTANPPQDWSDSRFNDPQQPVVGVSWDEAQLFCRWAECRLPTEAEWEYACRAGSQKKYCFGDDEAKLEEFAWYSKNSGRKPHPVGQKRPNAWSLYDLHGNVWEWCQDWYGPYPQEPITDATGPAKGNYRVLRGGSFYDDPDNLRCSNRYGTLPVNRYLNAGFRVVCVAASAR